MNNVVRVEPSRLCAAVRSAAKSNACAIRQHEEHHKERRASSVRHHQVQQTRAGVLLALGIAHDENVTCQRHTLPGQEEGDGVAGAAYQHHAADKHVEGEHLDQRGLRVRAQVSRPINRGGGGDQRNNQEEEGREAIHRKGHFCEREHLRQHDVQRSRPVQEHPQRDARSRDSSGQREQMSDTQNKRVTQEHLPVGAHVALSVADVMAAKRVANSVELRERSHARFTRLLDGGAGG